MNRAWSLLFAICFISLTTLATARDPEPTLRFRRVFIPFGQETRLVPPNYKEFYIVDLEAELARREAAAKKRTRHWPTQLTCSGLMRRHGL